MTSNPNAHGMYYVFTTNDGSATAEPVISETTGTAKTIVTAGTNQISLSYGLTGSSVALLIWFGGSVTD